MEDYFCVYTIYHNAHYSVNAIFALFSKLS